MATQKLSARASISLQMMEQAAPAEETFDAFAMVQPFSIRSRSAPQKLPSAQVAVIVEAAKGKDIKPLLARAKATKIEHIVDDFYSAVVPFENAKSSTNTPTSPMSKRKSRRSGFWKRR